MPLSLRFPFFRKKRSPVKQHSGFSSTNSLSPPPPFCRLYYTLADLGTLTLSWGDHMDEDTSPSSFATFLGTEGSVFVGGIWTVLGLLGMFWSSSEGGNSMGLILDARSSISFFSLEHTLYLSRYKERRFWLDVFRCRCSVEGAGFELAFL
ncbi:hypothetical protein VTL71DRAFT_11054 [Oculimacula yallundae]|uniref:Uncharacterized protein n=1 Tax=Oculimacula yallundae TaxID=86028 RepID=A0ABR4CUS3_9HELO